MRWSETCILIATEHGVDDEGVGTTSEVKTPVFCNARTVGINTWSSMYEIGVSPVAQIELRTCDYAGQRDVSYRDERYSVEVVQEKGDFTVLTLRFQQSDAVAEPEDEPGEEPEEDPGEEGTDG
jgi:hypothetical protein